MSEPVMYSGEGIKTFIPQREPFLMVDKLFSATENYVETGLTVKEDNILVSEDGRFSESGVIEHIAQSAACFAGYNDWINKRPIVLGYIAEIKKFNLEFPVCQGDELKSALKVVSSAMNVTLMDAEVLCNGKKAASCKIKIFMDKKK
jgi:3-hydroxymyristoyl/3-hydroxydecanoyl-(acyl carrier protein) dehydratase